MEQAVAMDRISFAGPVGPDALRIPAEPARLRQAAQQLGELADALDQAGQHLGGSEDRHQDRPDQQGHTSATVMKVARWNGNRLVKDAALLRELGEATQHAAQVVGDVQGQDLPRLRQRWGQAQDQFLSEIQHARADAAEQAHRQEVRAQEAARAQQQEGGQGGGQGGQHHGGRHDGQQAAQVHAEVWQPADGGRPVVPDGPPPHQLLEHLDATLVRPYEGLFRGLLGRHVETGGGGAPQAVLADSRTEEAMQTYRQTVRGVLEEFSALAQRVQQTAQQVARHEEFPVKDRADDEQAALAAVGGGSPAVSGLPVLRDLVADLRSGSEAYTRAEHAVPGIAAALRDGMLPDRQHGRGDGADGAGEGSGGFRATWTHHVGNRATRLATVAERVEDVMDRLSRIDEECAAAIRAH